MYCNSPWGTATWSDLFVIYGAKDLVVKRFMLSSTMEGWFVSSAMVGAVIGCDMPALFFRSFSCPHERKDGNTFLFCLENYAGKERQNLRGN